MSNIQVVVSYTGTVIPSTFQKALPPRIELLSNATRAQLKFSINIHIISGDIA